MNKTESNVGGVKNARASENERVEMQKSGRKGAFLATEEKTGEEMAQQLIGSR